MVAEGLSVADIFAQGLHAAVARNILILKIEAPRCAADVKNRTQAVLIEQCRVEADAIRLA
jgi:hypothetical protein